MSYRYTIRIYIHHLYILLFYYFIDFALSKRNPNNDKAQIILETSQLKEHPIIVEEINTQKQTTK